MSLPTPRHSTRGTEGYSFAELFLVLGPAEIGDPRENRLEDLIGRVYALVVTTSGVLELYQRAEDAATWTEVTAGLPPIFGETQPETRRRFSIAFDQSARAIVAYEEDSTVYLTRWDSAEGAYIQNVTVPGVDPVVVFDATWAYDVTVSDVLLFYLSTDRERVLCRVQRDVYATAYEMHDYGTPVVLDRVLRLPLRYQVLASDAAGDPLETGGAKVGLLSEIYPYPAGASMEASATPATAGVYTLVVLVETPESVGVEASAVPATGGSYDEPIITNTPESEGITASALPADGGDYVEALITRTPDPEAIGVTITGVSDGGSYDLVVLVEEQQPEGIDVSATGPTGGSYDLA